jgi:hypothetical protein
LRECERDKLKISETEILWVEARTMREGRRLAHRPRYSMLLALARRDLTHDDQLRARPQHQLVALGQPELVCLGRLAIE